MSMNNALAGMNAASKQLGVISNNIANSNTTAFKASRAEFSDVFLANGNSNAQVGSGVRLARVAQQFQQGDVTYTNNSLDLALSGEGFFQLQSAAGPIYSRAGNFAKDANGYIVNPEGARLQVYAPSVTGVGYDLGRIQDLRLPTDVSAPIATTKSEIVTTLPSTATPPVVAVFDPADPQSYNNTTSLTVYDSLGNEHIQTIYYVKTANPNEWEVYGQMNSDAPTNLGTLQYSNTGSLISPTPAVLTMPTFTPATGAAPMDIEIELGKSVQYGSAFSVTTLGQNGNTTGQFAGVSFEADGSVLVRYDNGVTNALGQVVVARFNNPQGLMAIGGNSFTETSSSGVATNGQAGSSGYGSVVGGALESSNTNLTEALIEMMTAQRFFQSNSQMVSTQDQIMQTVINLR